MGLFYQHELILIQPWISNHISSKMWDEITYPFPHHLLDVITVNLGIKVKSMLVKGTLTLLCIRR